jgi:hypothetical protein
MNPEYYRKRANYNVRYYLARSDLIKPRKYAKTTYLKADISGRGLPNKKEAFESTAILGVTWEMFPNVRCKDSILTPRNEYLIADTFQPTLIELLFLRMRVVVLPALLTCTFY